VTEQRMRELLREVADVVSSPNVVDEAWRRSVRVRRRRMVGTAVLAAGSVVAVIGVVGFVTEGVGDGPDGLRGPSSVAPPATPEAASQRAPLTRVDDADAWLGPTVAEESRLPRLGWELPGTIDLTSVVTTDRAPVPAFAAFAAADDPTPESILLLGADERVSRLELPALDPVRNPNNELVPFLNLGSLSPDGRRLVFPQPHGIVIYDIVTGHAKPCEVNDVSTYYAGWSADGAEIQLPNDTIDPETCAVTPGSTSVGDDDPGDTIGRFTVEQAYWPSRSWGERYAEAAWDLQDERVSAELTGRELIAADGPRAAALLVLPETAEDRDVTAPGARVVTWLNGRTVAFESQAAGQFNVLGWDITDGMVSLVSEIAVPDDWDAGVIASWADLPH
jgi:hypothetical protein